jgi:hypothetical protein
MDDQRNLEKELEREREKLHQMINETRQSHQSSSDILEQSQKVDILISQVQKQLKKRKGEGNRHRNDQQER